MFGWTHLGQDLVEGRGFGLLFLLFPFQVRMLGMAGLADDFGHLVFHKAGDGMIHQTLAARAMVVDQIAKPRRTVIKP